MARSYLFVPGDAGAKLEKAWTRGADALIVDLEDAVPPANKDAARGVVADWLGSQDDPSGPIWVRVNNEPGLLEADITAASVPSVAGIVVPKIADSAQVATIRALIDDAVPGGGDRGLLPMVETPVALVDVNEIARCAGVTTLMVGEYDLAAELSMEPDPHGAELYHARAATVVACAAAGIAPPIGAVSANIVDMVRFDRSTRLLKRMGYYGRAVIHPEQVRIVNDVYTPRVDEVTAARGTLAAFDEAVARGDGVLRDGDGNLLDEAIVRSARRTMEAAAAAGIV